MPVEITLEASADGKMFATDRGDYWLIQEYVYFGADGEKFGEIVSTFSISKDAIEKLSVKG